MRIEEFPDRWSVNAIVHLLDAFTFNRDCLVQIKHEHPFFHGMENKVSPLFVFCKTSVYICFVENWSLKKTSLKNMLLVGASRDTLKKKTLPAAAGKNTAK